MVQLSLYCMLKLHWLRPSSWGRPTQIFHQPAKDDQLHPFSSGSFINQSSIVRSSSFTDLSSMIWSFFFSIVLSVFRLSSFTNLSNMIRSKLFHRPVEHDSVWFFFHYSKCDPIEVFHRPIERDLLESFHLKVDHLVPFKQFRLADDPTYLC